MSGDHEKTQEGSWKYPWLLPCFAKERVPNVSGDRQQLVASPQDLNPRTKFGCIATRTRAELSQPKHHEDHITRRSVTSVNHYNLVHKFIQMQTALKIPDDKAAVDKEGEEARNDPSLETGESSQQERGDTGGTRGKRSPLCFTDGHLSLEKCGVETETSEGQRTCGSPW